ncbi:MAG: DNA-directed RNA polymerase subunit beta' [Mycoplasma sp.]|nr:DNA-directed RNA polymerase subunit beta' [Mycoplasma sp.]
MNNLNNMKKLNGIRISLADKSDIKEWSHGEVTKPETINYKTFKPERNGLFDERVFGPSTDYKCPICGKKYKRADEGNVCKNSPDCKILLPEILPKISRRTRMGHIELATPIAHIWFFKINHSTISKLLGLKEERANGTYKNYTKKQLEDIIYFKSHIVLESDGIESLPKHKIINIQEAGVIYRNVLNELLERHEEGSVAYKDISEFIGMLENSIKDPIQKEYGVDFYEYNAIIQEYSKAKIGTGAEALQYLLKNFDLKGEAKKINDVIDKIKEVSADKMLSSKKNDLVKLYKRLKIINNFIKSEQQPDSMILEMLPVIPAGLRPIIQLDGGRHSTSDVNELYRRIIIRNNRLKKWYELDAPELIIQNEKRMLQETVDALLDNTKKPTPLLSKDRRPLKSIADVLAGKKGRFRQNLLGKRVDYSGRSVIVVGPNLKMHQAGIPRQMIAKLFEPFIVKELVQAEVAPTVKVAKKLIDELDNIIWPYAEKAIEGRLVLLNRAPTLHRLSIQAFEPIMIRGKAIQLHPLVTTSFNADFDGDQMAVHVPLSDEAIEEARELMLANRNILGPKDGEPIINPSQDMILGLFYLTMEEKGALGEGSYFSSYDEMMRAFELKKISLHAKVALSTKNLGNRKLFLKNGEYPYVFSTVGKFILNNVLPKTMNFIFDSSSISAKNVQTEYLIKSGENIREIIQNSSEKNPLKKGDIAKIVRKVFDDYKVMIAKEDLADVIKKVNSGNVDNMLMNFQKMDLNPSHASALSGFIKNRFEKLNKKIKQQNQNVERVFEREERAQLLTEVWFDYTNMIASVLDKIKELGFKWSMLSGTSIAISDIDATRGFGSKEKIIAAADKKINMLKNFEEAGQITDDEKYNLTVETWTKAKNEIETELEQYVKDNPKNPISMMMVSGARSSISNFVQLAGMRGLMSKNTYEYRAQAQSNIQARKVISVPVKSSFLDGLSSYEFFSSTSGARKGLTDTALNTAESGYLTRKLVDASQDIIVREEDCNSNSSFIAKDIRDTKNNSIIVSLRDRVVGRYTSEKILDEKGELVIDKNELITDEIAEKIEKMGLNEVKIRSILDCKTVNGVCKKCYGVDLATNTHVSIGEAVGIVAAQSIGEPGTQLTMRTFHTGGVAGVADITGGFQRLKELIDILQKPWGEIAIISKSHGTVEKINKDHDKMKLEVVVKNNETGELTSYIPPKNAFSRKLRVKVGDVVKPGQKIFDGPIKVRELLKVAGYREVQMYLIKEIQRLYRPQGINIADKYIEIIIMQMLSRVIITDSGDSKFNVGELVNINTMERELKELISKGMNPPKFEITIQGVKSVPSLSESFLSAASYQETSQILVNSSIEKKTDDLDGLKENIIIGNKIPCGTGYDYKEKGKYDIRKSIDYFE